MTLLVSSKGPALSEYVVKAWDIDAAFDNLNKNSKGISSLMKDLSGLTENISAAMRAKSLAREPMTEDQISAFSSFNEIYAGKAAGLASDLDFLTRYFEMGDKNGIIDDLFAEGADFGMLYGWLMNISQRQRQAIANINGIISAARDTLQLIA